VISEPIYDSTTKTLKQFEATDIRLDPDVKRAGKKTTLTLHFLTPTRIIYNNRLTLELEFHIFLRNLLRRLSLIHYFHSNDGPVSFDFAGLIKKAGEIKVLTSNLRWYDWERYSGRQERKINMGGFVGDITFEGVFKPFMPLIKAGEVLHVGKGTAFGLGRYGVE